MKDTENVKNYCKNGVEPNSILPREYHIIDGLWLITTQNALTLTVVSLRNERKLLVVNPLVGIIKLNMCCTATSGYQTLLTYHHIESKSNIQVQFIDNLKSYNGYNFQIWKPFISSMPNFT